MRASSSPYLPSDRSEHPLIAAAVAVAVIGHLVFLMLPLPERDRALVADRPAHEPFEVNRTRLPPPPPRPEQPPERTRTEIRLPVPIPDPPPEAEAPRGEDEPVVDAPPLRFEPDLGFEERPPAPPAPAIVELGHEGLVPPEAIEIPSPPFPEFARRARLEATVTIRAVIDGTGRVIDAELLRVDGRDLGFSEATLESIATWRYRPGTLRGRPVAVRLTITVHYSLD